MQIKIEFGELAITADIQREIPSYDEGGRPLEPSGLIVDDLTVWIGLNDVTEDLTGILDMDHVEDLLLFEYDMRNDD